jgi:hypothetical protein
LTVYRFFDTGSLGALCTFMKLLFRIWHNMPGLSCLRPRDLICSMNNDGQRISNSSSELPVDHLPLRGNQLVANFICRVIFHFCLKPKAGYLFRIMQMKPSCSAFVLYRFVRRRTCMAWTDLVAVSQKHNIGKASQGTKVRCRYQMLRLGVR